ncbi:three-helix bundle dimerization domain-containing protein [Nocardia sp. NPDC050630]|uniref:three-helix bundle dimerization domain-containing protein n=1 Tax=Nocardia sp. NPDC050630 TaxID=3364321 RepID=UPI0037B12E49
MGVVTVREEQAIARLTDRLVDDYPADQVESAVGTARQRFEGHPVREFVPILIERIARRELEASTKQVETENVAAQRDPNQQPDPARGMSRIRTAGAEFAVDKRLMALAAAVLVVVLALVVAFVVRQPDQPTATSATAALTTVHGVVGSEKMAFFDDPRVVEALAHKGLEARVDPAGSRQIATSVDLGNYDFAFPSSAPAAERIQRARNISTKYTPFSSPMAIATYQPIADLLTAAGVVRPGPVPTFDMARYLQLVRNDVEWDKLRDNTVYPVHKNILVSTTDPRTSNSAAMYLAIASHVANDNTIVQGPAAEQAVLPTVSRLFVRQGYTENSTDGPFREYLAAGMGPTPMVWIYEAQFVEASVRGQIKPGMMLIYPSPTVVSQHTLVPLTTRGDRVGRLLATDPDLQRLAAEHGFRTSEPSRFAKVAADNHVPVAGDVIDVIDTPTIDTLEHLIDSVTKSYN